METRELGNSGIRVSLLCLGTMTWGEQNTQEDGFAQMDYALEQGINFFDTAEMYPVPPRAETYTRTETIIGNWFKKTGNRNRVVLATKIAGRGAWIPWVRDGKNRFDRDNIRQAVDGSLKRLQTDHIDLYQLHWPDRKTNFFGQLSYGIPAEEDTVPIEETLTALADEIKAGKIRHIGVSNETPWGFMTFLKAAEKAGLPRIVSIQNPYSLLNRSFEIGLAEIAHREKTGLLAYSPLGFGVLSGKYLKENPEGARLTLFGGHFKRYTNDQAIEATKRYVELAREHNLSPAQMALAFVNSRKFLTSNIIGARTMEQLKENINSVNVTLEKEVLKKIDEIQKQIPNPSP